MPTFVRPSQIAKVPIGFNIPSIFKADVSEVTVVNTLVDTALFSHTLPGGAMGASDQLWYYYGAVINNTSGSTVTYTLKLKYGATTIITDTGAALATGSSNIPIYAYGYLKNATVTNSQKTIWTRLYASSGITSELFGTAAIDSTVNQLLQLTVTMNLANAGASITGLTAQVQLMPAT